MKKKQKKRLAKEYLDLCKKINKLDKFLDRAAYDTGVSNENYRLLRIQYFAMCSYEGALRMRMNNLGIEL